MSLKIAEKLFNISSDEWPRTFYAWVVRFFHQSGYVLGFTVITAIFVTRFSISALPLLFLIQAVLTIVSLGIFSYLDKFLPVKTVLVACVFLAASSIFCATIFLHHDFLFFGFLLLALGIFIPQLTISLSSFIEEFFSPLECERTFPLIESAQTLGGIFAGLFIASLSLSVASYKFLFVWIFFLFLMMAVILVLQPPSFAHHPHQEQRKNFSFRFELSSLHKSIREIKAIPFLRALLIIFLIQWTLAHVLEFQFTKVIEEGIHNSNSALSHEESLTHGLGSFHILFYASALVVQFLIASRIFKALGLAGSFLLHAIVTFLSAFGMLIYFGNFTLVLAKNNFEVSGIVHKNAYEASYYALKHGTQKKVREFFEALIYPFGTIIGTSLLLVLQGLFGPEGSLTVMKFLFMFLTVVMMALSFYLQNTYTRLVKKNLLEAEDQLTIFRAIEILSQKGHRRSADILLKGLFSNKHSLPSKVKILETLGKMGEIETVPEILHFLHSREPKLVLASLKALSHFPKLAELTHSKIFTRFRVLSELKKLFLESEDEQIQITVIKTLAKLNDHEIVQFILGILKNASPSLQAACIRACSLFQDQNISYFLDEYLKHKDPLLKAHTIAALWPFKKNRKRLRKMFQALFDSPKREELMAALSIVSDIGEENDKKKLIPYLTVIDPELRLYAAHALLKLGYGEAAPYFAPLLLSKNPQISKKAFEFLAELQADLQKFITHLLRKEVARRFDHAYQKNEHHSFFSELLDRLKKAYLCVESYTEADYIDTILQRQKLCPEATYSI
jgi:HEAT repeat protein